MPTRDETFMEIALRCAGMVRGRTGGNPPVGCVIVKDGRVIAHGATQPPGGFHAEAMAIQSAEARGHSVTGSEVYVILEPCAFTGRTPPCSRLLIAKRPRRTVIAVRDPHPLVRGRGLEELRGAGIEVVEGVLAGVVRRFLSGWLARYGAGGE